MNTKTIFRAKRTWVLFGLAAALPLFLQSNAAVSGPGLDGAVADNRAAMCSLPPFLNVAITEKPNIMVVYDNSTSMSLAAYTRPYDPNKDYYGIFDSDGCYSSTGRQFAKKSIYEVETTEIGGVWETNPAFKTDPDRLDVHNGYGDPAKKHTCNDSSFPYNGNFLNWATMRRIDLLRKAFTGGLGSNSGTQRSNYLAGEGTQTGGDKFAPCFSKSYVGSGVSPYNLNQIMVEDGVATWGMQCPAASETILASTLRVPTGVGAHGEALFASAPAPSALGFHRPATYVRGRPISERELARLEARRERLAAHRATPRLPAAKAERHVATAAPAPAPAAVKVKVARVPEGWAPPPGPHWRVVRPGDERNLFVTAVESRVYRRQPAAEPVPARLTDGVWHLGDLRLFASLSDVVSLMSRALVGSTPSVAAFTAASITDKVTGSSVTGKTGEAFKFSFTATNGARTVDGISGSFTIKSGGVSVPFAFSNAQCSTSAAVATPLGGANLWAGGATKTFYCDTGASLPSFAAISAVVAVDLSVTQTCTTVPGCTSAASSATGLNPGFTVTKDAPDLTVSAIGAISPNPVAPGATLTVTVTVDNLGTAASVLSKLQIRLGGVAQGQCNVPALTAATGASTSDTAVVNCAVTVVNGPGSYALVARADAAGDNTESDELNNDRTSGTLVTVAYTDLEVAAAGFSPEDGVYNDAVAVDVKYINASAVDAPASTLSIGFRSSTGVVTTAGTCATPALVPGDGALLTCVVNVPVFTPGAYTVVVKADPTNLVSESNEVNNAYDATGSITGALTFTVNLAKMPDLKIDAAPPTGGYVGKAISFPVVVENGGDGQSPATTLQFVLVSQTTGLDVSVLAACYPDAIPAGDKWTGTCSVTVPSVGYNTYTLHMRVGQPCTSSVTDLDCDSNDKDFGDFKVTPPPKPDLQITAMHHDLSAGLIGMPVNFVVDVENLNDAGVAANVATLQIKFGTTVAATCLITSALPALSTTTVTCAGTVPAVTKGLPYNVLATIDSTNAVVEDNELNNTWSEANGFYVHQTTGGGESDLQVVSIDTVPSGVVSTTPGAAQAVTVRIANVGSKQITLSADVIIVLSGDGVFTTGDLNVGTCVPTTSPIPTYPTAGWTQTLTCTANIPATVNPALYQAPNSYLAAVVPSNTVWDTAHTPANEDSDHAPNTAATHFAIQYSAPKLRVASIGASPSSSLNPGDTITITVEVANSGRTTNAFGGPSISAVWSTDNALGGDTALVLADAPLAAGDPRCTAASTIGSGATVTYRCTFTVPAVGDGSYYVFATVDPGHAAGEPATDADGDGVADEWPNNTQSTVVSVGVTALDADYVVTNVNLPAEVGPGQTLTATYSIANIGSVDAVTYPTVSIELVADGGSTTAECTYAGVLAAGDTVNNVTCTVNVPGTTGVPTVTEGRTYTVRIVVDPHDRQPEGAGESNNDYTGSVDVVRLTSCSGASCDHVIKNDFGGRGRVGILWSFRKKATGTIAPANLGVTTIEDWDLASPFNRDGTGFSGVEQNQQPANNIIPHLEAAGPIYPGKLARTLMNTMNYYSFELGFQDRASGGGTDPMLYDPVANAMGAPHPCRKNYVLLISDGYSFDDNDALSTPAKADPPAGFPADIKLYAANFSDPTASPLTAMLDNATYTVVAPKFSAGGIETKTNGTYHLDNVARYGHDVDLRDDIGGKQTVNTVVVHTFSSSDVSTDQAARATRLMRATAISGSYVEQDTPANGPNQQREWDVDYNGVPDGYFEAREGDDIGEVILNALNSILLKTASGTSVSVIASTTRGEGAIYQSYFRPTTAEGSTEVTWLGYLQALWVDRYGNLREDSDYDPASVQGLSMTDDYIVRTQFNTASKETLAVRWQDSNGDGTPDVQVDPTPIPLTRLQPIFEAGKVLWNTRQAERNLWTWPHPPAEAVPSNGAFEALPFTDSSVPTLKSYMWPAGNQYYNHATMTTEVERWIRGATINDATFRNKRLQIDGEFKEWKLGDIVYSTPTIVGAPEERYDVVYAAYAQGYFEYFQAMKNRQRAVLIGGNDGMLHAFNGGVFKDGDNPATPVTEAAWFDPQGTQLGSELWGYIPGSLLPNLRMLADAGYDTTCHIYYVDLKPKVTDVQIFFNANDGTPLEGHPNGWGTIVIGGMRLGCGAKQYSSYFILDITDPSDPTPAVLAEFGQQSVTSDGSSLSDRGPVETGLAKLNFTYFYPVVLRVNDMSFTPQRKRDTGEVLTKGNPGHWYMVAGSGPDQLKFNSTNANAAIYVFDLSALGERSGPTIHDAAVARHLEDFTHAITVFDGNAALPLRGNTIISNGLSADLSGDFSVDTAYFTTQSDTNLVGKRQWGSEIWRLNTAAAGTSPRDWKVTNVFSTIGYSKKQPAVAAPGITRDDNNNIWLFFGTGRFLYKKETDTEVNDLTYGNEGTPSDPTYQQSLYGIIDPCWNGAATYAKPGSVLSCPDSTAPLTPAETVDSTLLTMQLTAGGFQVTGAQCRADGAATCTPDELAAWAASGVDSGPASGKFGWRINLSGPSNSLPVWEMAYSKPAVAGGLVLFTTYLPGYDSGDQGCALSGISYLYALDYRTGAASASNPLTSATDSLNVGDNVNRRVAIGQEPPSPPAIFGKSVFVQGSNANITRIQTQATFRIKPHVRSWLEQ